MAKFFSVPTHNGAFSSSLIERVYVDRAGRGVIYLSSNKTVILPDRFSTEDEVLKIVAAIWDHPDFKVEWHVAAESVSV